MSGDAESEQSLDLTSMLNQLGRGERAEGESLLPYIVDELRSVANAHLRRQEANHTLQPTALVNEAYLKLFDPQRVGWHDRHHFFAVAAKAMRQILVDHARRSQRRKRGGGDRPVALDEAFVNGSEFSYDVLDIDAALQELGAKDERQAKVVELRYFAGLEVEEVAQALGLSKSTVEREWRAARAWLGHRIQMGLE